ncbi:MAG: glycosyltransferase family 2 protein, partial [Vulcanococcus sp.]
MDGSPRLSILVATWNCAAQLEQFLESLLAQSWTDWECLLLDNASTDGTAELVAGFQLRLAGGSQRLIWS